MSSTLRVCSTARSASSLPVLFLLPEEEDFLLPEDVLDAVSGTAPSRMISSNPVRVRTALAVLLAADTAACSI